jgi:hypothetical protein
MAESTGVAETVGKPMNYAGVNAEIEEAYTAISETIFDFANTGVGIDITNLEEVFKQVMEGIEALGQMKHLSGAQKGQLAQNFSVRLINDLHEKKLVTDEFYEKASDAVKYIGPAVFTAIVLASKGKILINKAMDAIEETKCYQTHCAGKCCVL